MSSRTTAVVVRIAIAVVVVGAVVWWLKSRGGDKSSPNDAAGAQGSAGAPAEGRRGGGGGGGASDRVVPVQVAPVVRKDVPIWIEGLGSVAAFQQVTVRPQVDGRLDKVLFTEGQLVKKGDVIAQIDPRPFYVQLHQAQGALARDKATLDTAKRNLERYKGLQEQKLVAQQQVDDFAGQVGQAEGAVKMDQSQIENAQLQLDYAQVKSPLDGVTGVRQVDAGNLVKAADPTGLVVITAIDPAAVLFTIPQDRLPGIVAAQGRGDVVVEVWNRDSTQKLAAGKLAVVDNQINQTTATLRLKALVPNPSRVLWPNAFVKARLLLETRKDALVVPNVAIQRGPQGVYVYTLGSDKTAALKPVKVALVSGDQAILEGGVEPGDQVIVEGQNQIRPGSHVEATKPGGPGGGDKPRGGGQRGQGGGPGSGQRGSAGPTGSAAEPTERKPTSASP